jgi:hypothetical protein
MWGQTMAWPASFIADLRTAISAWNSVRGGWAAAWRDTAEFARHHQIAIQTSIGARVVLRTQIRLTGDVQTEIVLDWLNSGPEFHKTADAHFRSVAAAIHGWSAVAALIRIASHVLVAAGSLIALLSAWRNLPALGWSALLSVVLSQGWVLAGITTAALGFGIRKGLSFWLRRRFRRGLAGVSGSG